MSPIVLLGSPSGGAGSVDTAEQVTWFEGVDRNQEAEGQETGIAHDLMDIPNIGVLVGRQGAFMPPIELTEERVPLEHGSRIRHARAAPRIIDLPLHISSSSASGLRVWMREILGWFRPFQVATLNRGTEREGKLRVVSPDGAQREIYCVQAGGLQGNESQDVHGVNWCDVIVSLRATNPPFWQDRQPLDQTFTAGSLAGFFFPILPLRLASGNVFGSVDVNNQGDVESWPVWILTGPMTGATLQNLTTGRITVIEHTLTAGETIHIDTQPGRRQVRKGDGTVLWSALTAASALWSFDRGVNSCGIGMSGYTDASSIQLLARARYFSP